MNLNDRLLLIYLITSTNKLTLATITSILFFISIFLVGTSGFKLMASMNPTPKRQHTEINSSPEISKDKTYLDVSYAEKDEAKLLGAQFDWNVKKWFAPNNESELIKRWGNVISSSGSNSNNSNSNSNKRQTIERNEDNDLIGVQYLYVPFEEKDEAKALGAFWDMETKKWFARNNEESLVTRWGINQSPLTTLVGEDRTFGGNQLFVDLIPSSCWFTNVRYCVEPKDWDRLRKFVYGRANHSCEVCTSTSNIEAHERWEYNTGTLTQKLVRLVALCHECHQSTHMGLAQVKGLGDQAEKHLRKVRKFSKLESQKHIEAAFETWGNRNDFEWTLDLSLITDNGITLKRSVNSGDRMNAVNSFFDQLN